jgi:hypothetical protein
MVLRGGEGHFVTRLMLLVLLVAPVCVSAAHPPELREMARQIVPKVAIESDAEFFAAWDLDHPGMEAVKAAVEAGEFPAAKIALKQYFLDRREPPWKRNHWEMPPEPQGLATEHSSYPAGEKILAHQFEGGGFEVDFGEKIDWNYFPKLLADGKPDTEYPVTHYINRFGHLNTLGYLYWHSHDERYAREFVYQVTDHVQSNPAPEGYIPYTSVWSRLTACIPLVGIWFDAWNYFLPSESFTPDDVAIMLKGFIQKARYAMIAPDSVNRYMAQLVAIYNVGAYFPELRQAADFRDFAVLAMGHAARDEFYPDGFSKELCPGYHGGSRGHLDRIINSARLMGYEEPAEFDAIIRATYDIYPALMTPLMGMPEFGDSWGTGDVRKVFAAIDPDRWDDRVHDWLAGHEGGAPPGYTSTRLPWAGYYAMRSGWTPDARYLCFDAGPLGVGHWHEDFGNFEMYAFGERLISDMGVHAYTLDDMQKYFYSSLAHNVVLVDGLTQTRAAEPQRRLTNAPRENDWHSDQVFDLAGGYYDGLWTDWSRYSGREGMGWGMASAAPLATHRRDICFVRDDYWVISDRLQAEGEHTFSQLFHLRPDREARVFDGRSAGTAPADERPNVVLLQADEVPATIILGRESPPQGWVAAGHGKFEPAPCISFDLTATGGAWYDTVVLPLAPGVERTVSVERIAVTDAAGAALPVSEVCALRISGPWGVDIYLNDLRQAEIGPPNGMLKRLGDVETDARAAVIRMTAEGQVIRASAVGASTLTVAGRAL